MAVEDMPIGFVREHRWVSTQAQKARLKAAGCATIRDLDKEDRSDMERLGGNRPVMLVHAFLLAEQDRTRSMWSDFVRTLGEIEKREGYVVDVGTGLNSRDNRPEFLDVVRGQVRRSQQGEASAENARKGKSGQKPIEFTAGQYKQARVIWRDVRNFPTYDAAKDGLKAIKGQRGKAKVAFSLWRAFRKFGPRPAKSKD
jgi:hypothetical protein